ncbi:hypothetical protein [uncultured Amnibacterium sp.]|uniref:hypothetical protein n=1 Tax=uncultured Amnibacterium sp. TaxID=1631851 RepID=UPI0035CB187E
MPNFRSARHLRWALLGLGAALTVGLALSACTGTGSPADAVKSVQQQAEQASCKPGDLGVGKKKTVTDSTKQRVLLTGGRCFDRINTPAVFLGLSDADNTQVNTVFCSKLDVEPKLNKALGHGISSSSTLSLVPKLDEGSGPRGLCTWSEDYLALRNKPGVPYWREVAVSYSLNSVRLSGEYQQLQDTLTQDGSMTFTKLSGIGKAALEYTGSTKPEAHGVIATDLNGATV